MKSAAVMFDLRRIALWIAIIVVPGGLLLLPLVIADLRRTKGASKPVAKLGEADLTTPNDDSGPTPRTPDGETPPRLAA
jgi:hypothetical protein